MVDLEFIPLETMKRIYSRWWITAVMAMAGGILGWAFHFFNPPVYEATAILSVMMDFSQRELTQYEQDYAFSAAGAIIDSTVVKDQIVTNAQINGILISQSQLAQQMFSEGRQSVWELHIRDRNPQIAADLANIWGQVANEALNTSMEHAIQAEQLQVQIDLLDACLPVLPGLTGPSATPRSTPVECDRYSLAEIQTALQGWTDELVQEQKLTQGILSTLEFALTGNASIPDEPVLYDQGTLTLAGALIGFVISLWVAGTRRVRHHD